MSIKMLSDELLFEVYQNALKIRLQEDFLEILRSEIFTRELISLQEDKNSLGKSSN